MRHTNNYSVKQIAAMAGVSAGTVDRVIHNRGRVSNASRQKVEAVLKEIDYRPNLMISAIGVKRHFKLAAVLPIATRGYWKQMREAIESAQKKYSHIGLDVYYYYYDQFDLFSCRSVYEEAMGSECDLMIIGPTFPDETRSFCSALDNANTPYIFVDVNISETKPLAFYGPDAIAMGGIQARLISDKLGATGEIAVIDAKRRGQETSNNSISRRRGFNEYLEKHQLTYTTVDCEYDTADAHFNDASFDKLFQDHPNISAIAVFNSRAYIVADYLERKGIGGINLVGCGLINENFEYLKKGHIKYILSERTDKQGSMAVESALEYLLYGRTPRTVNHTPIDILIEENVEFFLDNR